MNQGNPILTDRPAMEDALDFQPYIDSLAEMIIDPATNTPLTIGIFGQWGSGKTSLMQLIRKQVDAQHPYRTVWFNAWKYDREDVALWRALILRTLDALRPRHQADTAGDKKLIQDLDRLEQSVYQTIEWTELGQWTVDWAKALEGTVEGAAEIALSLVPGATPLVELLRKARNAVKGEDVAPLTEAFQREAREFRREQLRSVEQFIETFEQTVKKYILARGGRLVIFIDDLDRCLPERTIEVLEAIKLFLDVPGCFFVLGVDPAKIQEGIQLRYKIPRQSDEGANYLEKIIQVPFILPTIERQDMQDFVDKLNAAFPEPRSRCATVFAQGLDPNPRQIKRAINIFLLLWKLAGKRRLKGEEEAAGQYLSEVLTPIRLAKVVAIQHSYIDLYDLLKLTPRYLKALETHYRRQDEGRRAGAEQPPESEIEGGAPSSPALAPALEPYAENPGLRRLLTLFPDQDDACFEKLTPTQLRRYFTLAGRAETERRPGQPGLARQAFEPELVFIPAGPFTMGSTPEQVEGLYKDAQFETPQHQVELPDFWIGRYPVTNLEYQAFVNETGHSPPRHWGGGQVSPELADHPVVYVSWLDAGAYCAWLAEKSGQPYRLPSEAEWEKAARGTHGRIYPWGDDWDESRTNTKEAGPGTTTPVGQYSPAGDSPYGAADMAGNVWEWTNSLWGNNFDEPTFKYPYDPLDGREDPEAGGAQVLRGGAWFTGQHLARCAARNRYYVDIINVNSGLRVCVAPSS